MANETLTSSLRNKLTPLKNLIAIIEDIQPVSFTASKQELFEKAVAEAKESFEEIENTLQKEENNIDYVEDDSIN